MASLYAKALAGGTALGLLLTVLLFSLRSDPTIVFSIILLGALVIIWFGKSAISKWRES